ncbi:hypothetical protein J6590_034211 [Homalodisca vitripennis]|nr:hypothetical protein J6590_034211 [Homalodisca vitripennis]
MPQTIDMDHISLKCISFQPLAQPPRRFPYTNGLISVSTACVRVDEMESGSKPAIFLKYHDQQGLFRNFCYTNGLISVSTACVRVDEMESGSKPAIFLKYHDQQGLFRNFCYTNGLISVSTACVRVDEMESGQDPAIFSSFTTNKSSSVAFHTLMASSL